MKKVFALLGVVSIIFAGCGGPKDEKTAFIEATIESTCHIFEAENIFDPSLEEEAKEIYKKYGFDADDDAAMETLTATYENDEEVQAAIMKGLEECGGDLFSGLEDAFDESVEDMDLNIEEAVEEIPIEEPAEEPVEEGAEA
ncbi:hypothetical protein ACFL21_02525 [Patescibacteria group bacterium]